MQMNSRSLAHLNVCIDKVCGASPIHHPSILYPLKALSGPVRLPPLSVVPHMNVTIDLQSGPGLDLGLVRDFPFRVGDFDTFPRLSIKLPAMEWTLYTFTRHLYKWRSILQFVMSLSSYCKPIQILSIFS